jgi:hypothetical protein
MRPEFPHGIDSENLTMLRVEDRGWTCGMVRGSYICGNDANYLYVHQCADATLTTIAVCATCRDETCLDGPKVTTYWREQQREWGVR